MLLVANLAIAKLCKNTHLDMTESLAHWCACDSTHRELSNKYQHDRNYLVLVYLDWETTSSK